MALSKANSTFSNHDAFIPIPIETKRSIVSEASEFAKYFERAKWQDYPKNHVINESMENFVTYIKGLKNKFLEDLVLNKISMVSDVKKRDSLLSQYVSRSFHGDSFNSGALSKKPTFDETNFNNMRKLENEVDHVINEEEKEQPTANNETFMPVMTPEIGLNLIDEPQEDEDIVQISDQISQNLPYPSETSNKGMLKTVTEKSASSNYPSKKPSLEEKELDSISMTASNESIPKMPVEKPMVQSTLKPERSALKTRSNTQGISQKPEPTPKESVNRQAKGMPRRTKTGQKPFVRQITRPMNEVDKAKPVVIPTLGKISEVSEMKGASNPLSLGKFATFIFYAY